MGCGGSKSVEIGQEPQERRGSTSTNASSIDDEGPSQPRARAPSTIEIIFPPAQPPKTKKAEVFNIKEYEEIDRRAAKCPVEELYKSFEDLAAYLTEGAENEYQKVRACFTWLCSLDIASLQHKAVKLPENGTPLDILLRIHWQMANHAHVFTMICRAAELTCNVVTGMNKSAAYQIGTKLEKSMLGAQWNSVLVEDEWRLCDVFWASTCVVGRRSGEWALLAADGEMQGEAEDEVAASEGETMHTVNEFFFLTDPDKLICTHFPDNPKWQLMFETLEADTFEEYIYIRERFFEMGVAMTDDSHKTCIVKTEKGEIKVSFGLNDTASKKAQFRFLLYRAKEVSRASIAHFPLERYVFYTKTDKAIQYTIKFPVSGRFKMDLFGKNEDEHEAFDLLCSYLIDCPLASSDVDALPDNPDIGWGPGAEMEKVGLEAKSHEDGVINSEDGNVEIRFKCKDDALSVLQNLKHNELNEFLLQRHAIARIDGEELVINMKLPQEGLYAFKLFADDPKPDGGDLPNVCNYLIKVMEPGVKNEPYPELHGGILGKDQLSEKLAIKIKEECKIIKPTDGKFKLDFEASSDLELCCELTHKSMDTEALKESVKITKTDSDQCIEVSLPQKGEFGVNVYAQRKDDPARIYHIHTCLADYESGEDQSHQVDEEQDIVMIESWKEEVVINLTDRLEKRKTDGMELVGELIKEGAQEPPKKEQLTIARVDDEQVFKVKVSEIAAYRLTTFGLKDGILIPASIYSIIHREPYPEELEEERLKQEAEAEAKLSPEELAKREAEKEREKQVKALKKQLKAAIANQDYTALEEAIEDAKELDLGDDPDVIKAQGVLDYAQCSELLTNAMAKRDMKALEEAIQKSMDAGLEQKMGLQLQMARKILEQLKRIEKLRHDILNLDQKTIAEIKSYKDPPDIVHKVMAGVFILLGEPASKLKEWRSVQVLIGKTGKESLKRRISEYNIDKLDVTCAATTKEIYRHFNTIEVQDTSAGAATFYVWGLGTVEEFQARYEQAGGDLDKIKPDPAYRKRGSVSR